MSHTVVGMDLSSKKVAAMVLDHNGSWRSEVFKASGDTKDRAKVLSNFVIPLMEFFEELVAEDTTWAFIEQPLVGVGGPHPTIVQAQVQGVVLALSLQSGVSRSYPVNVQTWKREIVGRGNANKDDVKEWLQLHHDDAAGVAGDDQDLVDAACVALYGSKIIERGASITKHGVQLADRK